MNRLTLRTAVLGTLAALSVAACGQTGPLYLPERSEVVTRPATPTPQPPAAPDPAAVPPTSPTPPKR